MRNPLLSLVAASLLAAPAQAASTRYDSTESSVGTFVGLRFHMPLGERKAPMPHTSLAIAPTVSHLSHGTVVKTAIGEGIALDFDRRPSLSIAGLPVEQALGLRPSRQGDPKNKQSLSTGGWIAAGAGVAAVAGGLYFLYLVHEAKENSD